MRCVAAGVYIHIGISFIGEHFVVRHVPSAGLIRIRTWITPADFVSKDIFKYSQNNGREMTMI